MSERTQLFADDDLDLTGFEPKKPARPEPAIASQSAKVSGFKSREPKVVSAPVPAPVTLVVSPSKQQRRHRTGRNAQFNLKAKPETIAAFTALAEANGWVLGEALEKAVELLQQHYPQRGA